MPTLDVSPKPEPSKTCRYNKNNYTTIDVNMKNELNGKNIRIPVYCVPQNKSLRGLTKVLETEEESVIKSFKIEKGIDEHKMIPRVVITLLLFRLVAKYLKDKKLLQLINKKLDIIVTTSILGHSQSFLHEGSGELRQSPGL